MVDRDIGRPNLTSSSSKLVVLMDVLLQNFHNTVIYQKHKENDYQPEELDDEIVENISNSDCLYPIEIK